MPVPPSPVRIARRRLAALAAIGLLALAIERAVAIPLPADAPGPAFTPTPGHLVVSEVMMGGASASDEFIELFNPTLTTQPLEGLEVVYVTSTGATITRKAAWAPGATGLQPGAHLLIANAAGIFAGVADLTFANGLAATGGSVALRVEGAAQAIDAVGWGTAASTWLEARPAAAPPAGSSLERLPGGSAGSSQDTDDNLVDFAIQPLPDPQNSASAPIPIATPTPVPSGPASPSGTPESTGSPSAEPTETATASPAPSASASASDTPSPEPTETPAPTPTPTLAPTPTPTPTPISIEQARSMPDGSEVLVEGIALTDGDFTDGGGYLVDASAGLAVLLSDGTFTRGQLLRVAGSIDDRYSQRTIRSSAARVTLLGAGSEPLPADAATGSIGEGFEGQLVELTGLITSSVTTLSSGVAWDLDDGSGAIRVVVGTATAIETVGWEPGVGLTLIGVVGQRDSSGGGTAGFRVQPRDAADIVAVEPPATPSPTPVPTAEPTAPPSAAPTMTPTPSATPAAVPLVSIGEARAAAAGTHLRIRGVVTAQSGLLEAGSAVVQDSTGGILIRLGTRAGTLSLNQLVELEGVRATKAEMLSLQVSAPALRLGTQADPTPLRRRTGALGEADEALLVIVRGMVSSAVSRSRGGSVSFAIDDGSGPIRVTISPRSGIGTGAIRRGAWLDLRGVLGQQATATTPLTGYRLWPRMRADLVVIAAPVAGAGETVPCCSPSRPSLAPRAGGQVPDPRHADAGAPGPGVPPTLGRPHPTFAVAAPITSGHPLGAERHAPREAGLVVSGLGLAALAGLAAWFSRRRIPGGGQPATDPEPAVLETGPVTPLPPLSLLRIDAEDAQGERRILPPT